MKKKLYLLLAILSIGVFVLVACANDNTKNETLQETQGPTDDENTMPETTIPEGTDGANGGNGNNNNRDDNGLMDDVEDTLEDAGDRIEDGVDDVGDRIENGVDDTDDRLDDATDDNR